MEDDNLKKGNKELMIITTMILIMIVACVYFYDTGYSQGVKDGISLEKKECMKVLNRIKNKIKE